VEVVNEHDVAVVLFLLRLENPAAVRTDRQAVAEVFPGFKDLADFFGGEIEVPDGLGRIGWHEVDASRNNCPNCWAM
jgi:hypothetical protein